MPTMSMPRLGLRLEPVHPGVYRGTGVMLIMPGRRHVLFRIRPGGGQPLDVLVADDAALDTPD